VPSGYRLKWGMPTGVEAAESLLARLDHAAGRAMPRIASDCSHRFLAVRRAVTGFRAADGRPEAGHMARALSVRARSQRPRPGTAPNDASRPDAGPGWGSRRCVFADSTAFSRLRVQRVFEHAVSGATDAPRPPLAAALGRLLYLVHLGVLLWWLLDRTPRQRATRALVALSGQLMPSASLALRLPPIRRFVLEMDELMREGLYGGRAEA